jgi:hypothetical protein
MWLHHDRVVSDAERGGDAMMNPVVAFEKRCSRQAKPGPRTTPDTSRARAACRANRNQRVSRTNVAQHRSARPREQRKRVRRDAVTFETVRRH